MPVRMATAMHRRSPWLLSSPSAARILRLEPAVNTHAQGASRSDCGNSGCAPPHPRRTHPRLAHHRPNPPGPPSCDTRATMAARG
jgi:hypothetical protein